MSLHEINTPTNYTPEDLRVHAELAELSSLRKKDPNIARQTGAAILLMDKELFGWMDQADGEQENE